MTENERNRWERIKALVAYIMNSSNGEAIDKLQKFVEKLVAEEQEK